MTCEKIRQELAAYLVGDLSPSQSTEIESHLTGCAGCMAELEHEREAWQMLDHWAEQPLPTELTMSISAKAHAAVAPQAHESKLQTVFAWWRQGAMPLAMGLAAAIVSAVVVASKSSLDLISPLDLTIAGATWAIFYSLMFRLFFIGRKQGRPAWQFLAQTVLAATAMFLVLTYWSPLPSSVSFCSNYHVTQPFVERLSVAGSFFLFGSLYALIPMSFASFLSASRREKSPLLQGTLAGGIFVTLLAPGIVIQCAPFAFGVLAGWFGGALLGSIVGGALGYWLKFKFA